MIDTVRTDRSRRRSVAAGAGALLLLVVLGFGPTAGAAPRATPSPVGDAPIPSIADLLHGKVDHVSARAEGGFGSREAKVMHVTIDVVNTTDSPVAVRLPRGTLLATDDPTEQVAVLPGLAVTAASRKISSDPLFLAAPGTSHHTFTAYCAQHADFGPNDITRMHYAGQAAEPLRTVLGTIVADHPSDDAAQQAVWWLTDVPAYPVADPTTAKLLRGVDAKAFAAHPRQVVPDPAYTPMWARRADRVPSFGPTGYPTFGRRSTPSQFPLIPTLAILLAVAAVVGAILVPNRRRTAQATITARDELGRPLPPRPAWVQPAGWYPDPRSPGSLRWWDGTNWTNHQSPPR